MKLTLKDVIVIALTATLSFPVVYLLVLMASGGAHLEFSHAKKTDAKKTQELTLIKLTSKKDSLAATQSQTFMAIEQQKIEVAAQKKQLDEQEEHVKMEQQQLDQTRADLAAERNKLEKTVGQSDTLDKKRIKQLAKVYGAMRAEEAARILETLDDDLCLNILSSIGDDRQKAKIFSALSATKSAAVSKKLGTPVIPK